MSDALSQTSGDQATSGWRRDPSGRYEWRWWDGRGWTNRVANPAPPAPAAATAPPTPGAPYASLETAAALTRPGPEAPRVFVTAPVQGAADPPAPQAPPMFATAPAQAVSPPLATTLAPPAPAPVSPPGATVPATLPGPAQDPVADPFASLRAPRNSAPMSVAGHEPVALTGPDAAPASTTPSVRTYPTALDGTSGSKWDGPYVPEAPGAKVAPERRQGLVARGIAAVASFFRGFWEQEESYHSPKAGAQLPPHPKQEALRPPANYGRAGLVMLAALGVAMGAYLPWITYRIDDIAHHRTGADLGVAWGFVLASAAFAIAAVLGAKHRVMGWVTMGASVVVAAMVSVRLLEIHDQVVSLNTGPTVSAEVGIGLWIMLASAAIGLIAAFRLDTPAEIV